MKEIARFSERDADTYYHLMDCWERKWRDAYWEYRFNPPVPLGVTDPLEKLVADKECPIDQRWMGISLEDLVRDLFDSEEMQLHFLAFARGWVGGSSTVVTFCHIFF